MRFSQLAAVIAGAVFLPLCLLAAFPAVAADETIGSVKKVSGQVSVVRAGERTSAYPGFKLHAADILETSPDGVLGVILRDDSLLSLGPSSRIAIEKFRFVPAEGVFGITTRILRGTMAYVSGLIGRLAPESATFVTPVATIGVRGTRFAVRVAE
ncbi:MAG: FecR family protein [Candidatus Methylomirabilia bacterium]